MSESEQKIQVSIRGYKGQYLIYAWAVDFMSDDFDDRITEIWDAFEKGFIDKVEVKRAWE